MRIVPLIFGALLTCSSALAGTVSLSTADGVTLSAQTWGSGANGVVLVHANDRSSEDWAYFGDRLSQRGFNVIAVDLRGHGATGGSIGDEDYAKMTQDIDAAIAHLRASGATSVHLMGAELGANLSIHTAVADTEVTDIVLLSAGMNLNGVASPTAFETYGDRPALVVASSGDSYSARSASVLERKAQGAMYVEYIEGDAAGVLMINRDPQLEGKLVAWFNGTYDLQGQRSNRQVQTSGDDDVETSGVRFGDE